MSVEFDEPRNLDRKKRARKKILVPASFGARFVAMIIDSIAVLVLAKIFEPFSAWLALFVQLVYYTVPVAYSGQTLGKYLLGIKIQFHVKNSTFLGRIGRMLLREIIGKFISFLLLGYGFLRVLWRKDGRSLHDEIALTSVIRISSSRKKSMGWLAMMSMSSASLAVLLGIGYYTLLYTALPLRMYVRDLEANGILIDGINGSFRRGFNLKQVTVSQDNMLIVLNNLRFKIGQKQSFGLNNYHLEEFFVESAQIKGDDQLKEAWNNLKGIGLVTIINQLKARGGDRSFFDSLGHARFSLKLDQMDLNSISLSFEDNIPLEISRFYLAGLNLRISQSAPGFQMNQLFLQSDAFDLSTGFIEFNQYFLKMSEVAKVIVKPYIAPEVVKLPLDFNFQIEMVGRQVESFQFSAFRNQARMINKLAKMELFFENFEPQQFFYNTTPFSKVNMIVPINKLSPDFTKARGEFYLRNTRFIASNDHYAVAEKNGQRVIAQNFSIALWPFLQTERSSKVILTGDHSQDPAQLLAKLYFNKSKNELLGVQAKVLAKDLRVFEAPQVDQKLMAIRKSCRKLRQIASLSGQRAQLSAEEERLARFCLSQNLK